MALLPEVHTKGVGTVRSIGIDSILPKSGDSGGCVYGHGCWTLKMCQCGHQPKKQHPVIQNGDHVFVTTSSSHSH